MPAIVLKPRMGNRLASKVKLYDEMCGQLASTKLAERFNVDLGAGDGWYVSFKELSAGEFKELKKIASDKCSVATGDHALALHLPSDGAAATIIQTIAKRFNYLRTR